MKATRLLVCACADYQHLDSADVATLTAAAEQAGMQVFLVPEEFYLPNISTYSIKMSWIG